MGRGGGGGRNRIRPSDYDSYRETPSNSSSSTGQSFGTWDWSNQGVNAGLSAGPKDSSSLHGDGTGAGTRWARDDGTSGQSKRGEKLTVGLLTGSTTVMARVARRYRASRITLTATPRSAATPSTRHPVTGHRVPGVYNSMTHTPPKALRFRRGLFLSGSRHPRTTASLPKNHAEAVES
jgi:hypothetical protein